MADVVYRQCRLRRGNNIQTSWIPEKFAVKDKILDLKTDGIWDAGWTVEEIFGSMTQKQVVDARDAYKYHRNNTDI